MSKAVDNTWGFWWEMRLVYLINPLKVSGVGKQVTRKMEVSLNTEHSDIV